MRELVAAIPVRRVAVLFGLLASGNVLVWLIAVLLFYNQPLLLGLAGLAYGFGLRHAVDADHIAAIDNATRKLMGDGRKPLGIGLAFSLGHSTVVFAATLAILLMAEKARHWLVAAAPVVAPLGAIASILFLFAIAIANLALLSRRPGAAPLGLLNHICQPLMRLVQRSWHMYLIGFLFGLGFDTATEIGVLGLSAQQAAVGLPGWSVLIFPLLFMAGMTLVDSGDGILMLNAYGWALTDPERRERYNQVIVSVSVALALLIGIAELFQLTGGTMLKILDQAMRFAGLAAVGFFILAWAIASHRRCETD